MVSWVGTSVAMMGLNFGVAEVVARTRIWTHRLCGNDGAKIWCCWGCCQNQDLNPQPLWQWWGWILVLLRLLPEPGFEPTTSGNDGAKFWCCWGCCQNQDSRVVNPQPLDSEPILTMVSSLPAWFQPYILQQVFAIMSPVVCPLRLFLATIVSDNNVYLSCTHQLPESSHDSY